MAQLLKTFNKYNFMTKLFLMTLGLCTIGLGDSLFAQVKTQESSAKKVENGQIVQPVSSPQSTRNPSTSQPAKIASVQPGYSGSVQSQMPAVKVGNSKSVEAGSTRQPNRSAGMPSDKGRIVPREKLIEGK